MRSTGIVRKVDELGRVVLPIEVRRVYDVKEKDGLEIFTEGETIILKKYAPHCCFCETVRNTTNFKGKLICTDCIEVIKEAGR
jgi:transcriptional pleiotropic regulator of transition state genes